MNVKVEIETLELECSIEIKQNGDDHMLLIILSKSDFLSESGRAWHGKITEARAVMELEKLIEECYVQPSTPQWITINDGIQIKINLKQSSSELKLILRDIEQGMKEYDLMTQLLLLSDHAAGDATLKRVLDIIKSYFR